MKRLLATTAIFLAATTAATAGSVAPPVIEPPVVVAPAATPDFSGFYVGAMGSVFTGTVDPGGWDLALDGHSYGAFAGYNLQSGNVVYGVDVGVARGAGTIGAISYDLNYVADARVRLGYAVGNAMLYAAGGYSMAQVNALGTTYDASGFNVGAGLELNLTDNVFVAGEYVYRGLSSTVGPITVDVPVHAIQAKIGMRF